MYEYRSLILTTNKDFTGWGDFFVNENVTVPIVDRIIHRSHIFMMGGDSYRLKEKLNSISGVEIQDIGKKGIAVVLEAEDTDRIKEISKEINGWEEVIDFQLGYLNWEEVKDKER